MSLLLSNDTNNLMDKQSDINNFWAKDMRTFCPYSRQMYYTASRSRPDFLLSTLMNFNHSVYKETSSPCTVLLDLAPCVRKHMNPVSLHPMNMTCSQRHP